LEHLRGKVYPSIFGADTAFTFIILLYIVFIYLLLYKIYHLCSEWAEPQKF